MVATFFATWHAAPQYVAVWQRLHSLIAPGSPHKVHLACAWHVCACARAHAHARAHACAHACAHTCACVLVHSLHVDEQTLTMCVRGRESILGMRQACLEVGTRELVAVVPVLHLHTTSRPSQFAHCRPYSHLAGRGAVANCVAPRARIRRVELATRRTHTCSG